jgi:uncharacterized membrane protein YjjP (DUF1212 family)
MGYIDFFIIPAVVEKNRDILRQSLGKIHWQCEAFVLPTGIFLTVGDGGGESLSLTKRINYRTVDLKKIEMINNFSRNMAETPIIFVSAYKELDSIFKAKPFAAPLKLAASGIAAFVFTVLFKGTIFDGVASLLAGLLMYMLRELISRFGFFQFFELFICGLVAGFLSFAEAAVFSVLDPYKIIIGALTIFLPGVAITNGIKDALRGDIISSVGRLGEAVFAVAALGAGVGLALSIGIRWL